MSKISKHIQITDPTPPYANELEFVDKDIKDEFEGKQYIIGTPTNLQLARDIRKLIEVLKK